MIYKKIHFVIILFICPFWLYSQIIYFNNRIESNTGVWSGLNSILELEEGYLVGGTTGTPPNYYWHQITLMILDESGDKLDEKLIGDTISEYYIASNSLIRTNDSIITFAGTRRTYPQKFAHDEILLMKLPLILILV